MKKICIVGLGAIGGVFAAWLGRIAEREGLELSALARGATLEAVRRGGLVFEAVSNPQQAERIALRADGDPGALGTQDLVIVAVKGPALAAVAPAVHALCGPHTRVLSAMNGVPWWFFSGLPGRGASLRLSSTDPDGRLHELIPPARVIGCVVHLAALVPGPGRVRHAIGNGLIIGKPAGGADAEVDALAALLRSAGFGVTVSPRIQQDVWYKLWGNMTMNPVSALTGATADRILDDALVRGFVSAVMREAQALGAAVGVPIEQTPEERHAVTRKLGAFKTSMLQDVEAGRAIELDALVGAVREIGERLDIATPNIDALLGLTRLMARQRGLYPG